MAHKICGGCGKKVGVRTGKCSCGHEFEIKKKVKEEETPTVTVDRDKLLLVMTPGSGMTHSVRIVPDKCESLDDIPLWMERCQIIGEKRGITYSNTAFRYMARYIWNGEELKEALNRIPRD